MYKRHGGENMFDILVQQNLEYLKEKYSKDNEMYEKICALIYLLKKNIIPEDLVVLYNNDSNISENNIRMLA